MKKVYVGLALAATVAYLAAIGVGAAQAWTGERQRCSGDCQAGPRTAQPDWWPRPGILSDYEGILDNALAKVLDLSVSEIQTARDNGTTWAELAAQQGVSPDDLQAALADAHQSMIDQALADGVITQAQADALSSHMDEGPGFGLQGPMRQMPRGGMQRPGFGGRQVPGRR